MPQPVDRRAAYYPGLDGLRAIAVSLVIAYHVGVPHLDGGLLGVGVFFTLSGYLITSILISSWQKRQSLGLKTFWIRRARRLLPAVILVLVTVMIAAALLRPEKVDAWSSQALAALFYVANWATIARGESYFDRFEGPSPFEHLWSLSVEEQFYVIWPVLFLVMLKVFRGRLRTIAVVTFALGAVSMLELSLLSHGTGDMTRSYEGTDTRAGGLLWGAALAMVWHPSVAAEAQTLRERIRSDAAGALGLIGVFALVTTTTQKSSFIYHGGIALLTVATCGVLFAAAHNGTVVARVLGMQPLRWIGERTYGIYLWHMPVAAFLPQHTLYGNTWGRGIIVVAITIALAAASWTFVEDPIRKYGLVDAWRRGVAAPRPGARRRTLPPFVVLGSTLTALGVGGLAVLNHLPQTSVQEIAKEANKKEGAETAKAITPTDGTARPKQGAALRTSCSSVVHIGDSSSLGPGDDAETNVTDKNQRIDARYKAVGVQKVVEDIRGGRAIIEHFKQDKNGYEAVEAQKAAGFSGCWVIALGLNDAATIAAGGTPFLADARIDKIMQAIPKNENVMWVTSVTQPWVAQEVYDNKHMIEWNKKLVAATKRYPNMRVYDWAAEAHPHPEWFITNDANHTNGKGSTQKALAMARALAVAYPADGQPSSQRVVLSR